MRKLLNQALIAVLLLVSALGGGHNLVAHHDLSAGHVLAGLTGPAGDHVAGTSHARAPVAVALHLGHDGSQPPAHEHSDDCTLCHAHCCAPAILTSSEVTLGVEATLPDLPCAGVIPYGQRAHPPHRPPRAAA